MPRSKLLILGMVIPPLIGNPYKGYLNPYYWVDDHSLLYGKNGSWSTLAHITSFLLTFADFLGISGPVIPSKHPTATKTRWPSGCLRWALFWCFQMVGGRTSIHQLLGEMFRMGFPTRNELGLYIDGWIICSPANEPTKKSAKKPQHAISGRGEIPKHLKFSLRKTVFWWWFDDDCCCFFCGRSSVCQNWIFASLRQKV